MSRPSPESSCQWEMLTSIDRGAVCQCWPRLACGVHYRACDRSTGGEQCVIHIMFHADLKKGYIVFYVVLYCQINPLAFSNRRMYYIEAGIHDI